MSAAIFFFHRTGFIALNTLREALRQKILGVLALLALGVVVGAQGLRDFHFGSPELKFIADLGSGALALFGALLAVVATAQLFFSEIEHRTVQTLLAKPVGHAEFIFGKFLAVVVITAAFCGLITAVLMVVLWRREAAMMDQFPDAFAGGHVIDYRHLAVVGLMQWLKLSVLSALTLLVASYANTQLFTLMTGLLIGLICHLQTLAHRGGSRVGGSVVGWAMQVLPNFQVFDVAAGTSADETFAWAQLARVSLYALGYGAAACALAVFSFRRREI
ncbi:MAG: ABC transporter permease subunit [Opitutaceae bacterium]